MVAVLFDTMSIQDYIFSSNSLQENLGASYIIENIFDYFFDKSGTDENIKKIDGIAEKYFIGGGNALFLFDNKENALKAVREFSLYVISNYPGVKIAAGINENFEEEKFKESMQETFRQLNYAKNMYIPNTILPSHGFTTVCNRSQYTAEAEEYTPEGLEYVSSSTKSKLLQADKFREKLDKKFLDDEDRAKFTFASELELLGQEKGKFNYIAVIHADGNSMGKRFAKKEKLDELIKFSKEVKEHVNESFKKLIKYCTQNYSKFKLKENKDKYGRIILPIIPIIVGGDDITFITEGRIGLQLAKKFLGLLKTKLSDEEYFSACAGVAIVKTKFPFYKAYQYAESLCKIAKEKMRSDNAKPENSFYIDFHIATQNIINDLKKLRDKQYISIDNKILTMRPYSIKDFDALLYTTKEFITKKFPSNKFKELREVLYNNQVVRKEYVRQLKLNNLTIPKYVGIDPNFINEDKFFDNNKTPYIDIIEISDFIVNYNE